MHSSTLLAPSEAPLSVSLASLTEPLADGGAGGVALSNLRAALLEYAERPGAVDTWDRFLAARRTACAAVSRLPRKETQSPVVEDACALVKEMAASGAHDRRLEGEDFAQLATLAPKGWQGLLAAMLLAPAWQWPDAPPLVSVPDWLRADYVGWLFAAPQGFCEVGDAELYATHTLKRLEELVRWVNRSPGASAEAEVLAVFSRMSAIPLYFSAGSLRKHAELRGWLLTRALRQPDEGFDAKPVSREGRRLRVGVLGRGVSDRVSAKQVWPFIAQLDSAQFEVARFSYGDDGCDFEADRPAQAGELHHLPDELAAQLSMMRAAALDVLVFCEDLGVAEHVASTIAVHRVAPLQVAAMGALTTSGMPEIDLYVSGALDETAMSPGQFSERLALLPASAVCVPRDEAEPLHRWSREELGIPAEALVFAFVAKPECITAETRLQLAAILQQVPDARLLVLPLRSGNAAARLCADLERACHASEVADSRVHVITGEFTERSEIGAVVKFADVLLDIQPQSELDALVAALEAGIPAIAFEGGVSRARRGSALLRAADLAELIAGNSEEWTQYAVRLAKDGVERERLRAKITATVAKGATFADGLAASDAFGGVLRAAWDELTSLGRSVFREEQTPLLASGVEGLEETLSTARCFVDAGLLDDAHQQVSRILGCQPTLPAARHLMARVLLAEGNAARASDYFVELVQSGEASSELWRELANALDQAGNGEGAMMALETSLRVDGRNVESWFMLGEMAKRCGHAEMFSEVLEILGKLVPTDPRFLGLRSDAASVG